MFAQDSDMFSEHYHVSVDYFDCKRRNMFAQDSDMFSEHYHVSPEL